MLNGGELLVIGFTGSIVAAIVIVSVVDYLEDSADEDESEKEESGCGGGHVWPDEFKDSDKFQIDRTKKYVVLPDEYDADDHEYLKEYKGQAVVECATPESNVVGEDLGITHEQSMKFDRIELLTLRRKQWRRCQKSNCSSIDKRWQTVGLIEADDLLEALHDV